MSTATCDIRFSLQNRYARQRLVNALARLEISNGAVTISGFATRSGREQTKEQFIAADEEAIRKALERYLEERDDLPRPDDLVILDMEPRDISPRHLGDYEDDEALQAALIAAYVRRIEVARDVLRETGRAGLRVGLYQVIVPDPRGRQSAGFDRRMRGYVTAGEQGMYDGLDFICPVLYQRVADLEAIKAASQQAVEKSGELTRTDGTPIPLVPLLSFWVFDERRRAVTHDSLGVQLEIVQNAFGIEAIVFWSGLETPREMKTAEEPVEPIDIGAFLAGVENLPWPGCT